MIAERVQDVRGVVAAYDGEDDVARAFKERMSHLAHQAPRRKGLIGAPAAAAAAR
ncbi:hypothetical protein MNEG_16694 [Monoraphidium neglectum]|jgi:hypothetical protein|uniref:Uncharacterized protein n=1 Tax=Monoraphidium neglectum TaxID=145388 RepID=A0A0D2LGT1_9CHLO|nr:hypothetical protein MNEG_16694 [Monoraphidium neglectum]KIY91269.1 hypothetical protein MNEG_16694 [Monoraphidium neglectum]|eukprot:XP_013890289.1 hypothetical protein MNEG_16694 [Monoraphidium neglectum]